MLRTIRRLHKEQRKTVVMITHYIEEAIGADRVYLIHDGKMIADGLAREMLTQPELLGRGRAHAADAGADVLRPEAGRDRARPLPADARGACGGTMPITVTNPDVCLRRGDTL
ncbi:MAG: hypothetical protein ACLSHG_10400 [Oscillospiraceae bacterium]